MVLVALTFFHSRFWYINRLSSVELMMHVRRFTIRYRVHSTACGEIMHQHISFVACHCNNDNFIQCEAKINANDEDTSYRIQLLYFWNYGKFDGPTIMKKARMNSRPKWNILFIFQSMSFIFFSQTTLCSVEFWFEL